MRARVLSAVRRLLAAAWPRPARPRDLDLLAPDVVRDPYPHYAALRARGAVHYLARHGFWMVVGYDEVAHALKSPHLFSSVRTPPRFDPILNETDPPRHTRVRRCVAPLFSATVIEALEGLARRHARELLARGARAGELDLVGGFAAPLTERVIGAFMGLTDGEMEALAARLDPHRHTHDDGRYFDVLEEAFGEYAAALPERRTAVPCTRLLHDDGGARELREVAGLIRILWVAGTTTTSRLIPAAARLLLADAALRARVQADPGCVAALVEEAARLDPPEQLLWRVARPGAELAGTTIPEAAEVRLCVGAANRDPARFEEPDRVRLDRTGPAHLTFGAGPHYCPGTRLAKLQVRVALETLLAEWPAFAPARPLDTPRYVPAFDHRALQSLVVAPRLAS